jgi:hypothetical protein
LEIIPARSARPEADTARSGAAITTSCGVDLLVKWVSSLAQSDALAKLLIEKGIITQQEFLQKISEERATYQKLLNPVPH